MTEEVFKISNWNIERPKYDTDKTNLVISKILELNTDIIVLTETSNAVNLSDYFPYSKSTLSYDRTPDEQWVTIWSKWEIVEEIKTFDNHRTVCAKIKSPFGEIIVYGTIIPYHMAGVSGERYGNLDYKAWEFHEKDLYRQSADWQKIITKDCPLFVIGDFNQSRFNNQGYGTNRVRSILTDLLKKNDLTCVTEIDFSINFLTIDPRKGKIRNNIDHICISNSLINDFEDYSVGAWNHFTDDGKYLSDHNGVYIEFKIKTLGNSVYN
jgi:hypothetical protein